MKNIKSSQVIIIVLAMVVLVGGVILGIFLDKKTSTEVEKKENTASLTMEVPVPDEANAATITLKQDATQVTGKGVTVEKNKVKIQQAGTFVLTGKLSDGKVEIETKDKGAVILLLKGADITNKNGKAIESIQAEHTSVQMKKGTVNRVQSGEEGAEEKETLETQKTSVSGAAIYAVEEMSISGEGELQVAGYRNDGIKGKQSICMAGGTVTVQSKQDAVQADENLLLCGGNVSVKTGEGSGAAVSHTSERRERPGFDDAENWDMEDTAKESAKGFKCGNEMQISGGTYQVDSYDDSFHSNGNIVISDGEISVEAGDDGFHANQSLTLTGGKVTVKKSNEGLEANQIDIQEGTIYLTSSDDGMNAFGGNSKTGEETEFPNLTISGGTIAIDAGGDGLDSNGNLTINGGTTIVNGPTNDGNGALDSGSESGGKCMINGGTILAIGSSGMAETFEETSKQSSFLHNLSTRYEKGAIIRILDESQKELFSHTAIKEGNSIVFSSPELKKGETYTIQVGEQKETVTMESNSQSNGRKNNFPGGGMNGKPPKALEGRPGEKRKPEQEGMKPQ